MKELDFNDYDYPHHSIYSTPTKPGSARKRRMPNREYKFREIEQLMEERRLRRELENLL